MYTHVESQVLFRPPGRDQGSRQMSPAAAGLPTNKQTGVEIIPESGQCSQENRALALNHQVLIKGPSDMPQALG